MSSQVLLRPNGASQHVFPTSGDVINDRYRMLREIGRGGMGIVMEAHDAWLDRRVALKVLRQPWLGSPEAVDRFEREARVLAAMNTPHVVRVHDYGFVQAGAHCAGLPFMVLELLRGEDLFSMTERTGALSPAQVVRIALDVCAGLKAAHQQGVVHRDLKPENLFVALEQDGTERVKILDFGIARSHHRQVQTTSDCSLGSPGYMAPEQVQDPSTVGAPADIWSLGVVMYELLAHRAAFPGPSPEIACAQTLVADVPPLAELRPDVHPQLVAIIERCMQRSPERRFADAAALAEALEPLSSGAFVDATPGPADSTDHVVEAAVDSTDRFLNATGDSVDSTDRILNATGDSVDATSDGDEQPSGRSRQRRALAWVAAGVILAPSLALLPVVAQAPELQPARAWLGRAAQETRSTLQAAKGWVEQLGKR